MLAGAEEVPGGDFRPEQWTDAQCRSSLQAAGRPHHAKPRKLWASVRVRSRSSATT
jgi:hypothetical protein